MAKLVWDQIGEKLWETGVDRAVLFPMTSAGAYSAGVAWSGTQNASEKQVSAPVL